MFFLICMLISSFTVSANRCVDFDSSMHKQEYNHILSRHDSTQKAYDAFKTIYERNSPDVVAKGSVLKIPKIIHQIWLGKKLPKEYREFRKSWINHHPDWLFIFWTDNPKNYNQGKVLIETFQDLERYIHSESKQSNFVVVDVKLLNFVNRGFYDKAINYGEKSDILKWEIVYRFGGMYVDTDFECLKPLDELHYMYDFYTGIQPLDTNMAQLGAALYAAYPGHPILKECVEEIKNNQHIEQIVIKTGPIHFTRSFFRAYSRGQNCNVALPASFMYPCCYEQKGLPAYVWQRPESYAIHHWAGSWLRPEANQK